MGLARRAAVAAAGGALAGAALGGRLRLSSKKKGFCLVPKSTSDWRTRLRALDAKWFYTWGAGTPQSTPPGMEFVPMQWGKWNCSAKKMGALGKAGHKTLLGFNEPDKKNQANMSVAKAVELWPRLMETGLRLGSPAGVHADGEWMTAFMAEVKKRGYRVDFITVHSYRGASAKNFLSVLEKVRKLYNRPIWVTEFAVADWEAAARGRNKFSPDQILKFMESALPAMEKLDYIERYAWFSAKAGGKTPLGNSALFKADGTRTRLGEFYATV